MKTGFLFSLLIFTALGIAAAEPRFDVAAYVWPAYHPAPRWAELGIFKAGKGEWQSVWESKKRRADDNLDARPLWGYTNEADPEDVAQKIDAAVSSGINIFIYDWYWYGGRPFLEDALNKGFLGAPNCNRMKFYIMWANHDVNYYWDNTVDTKHGKEDLVWPAKVSDEDWKTIVARWIKQYFTKPNYYCIHGKPVLMIYRLDSFVEWEGIEKARQRLDYLRAEVKKAGFPGVHLQAKIRGKVPDYTLLGIDSYTLYNWNDCRWFDLVDHKTGIAPSYSEAREYALKRCSEMNAEVAGQGAAFFPNISIGWDNNARFPLSQTNRVIRNANPGDYEIACRRIRDWAAVNIASNMPHLVTVNSWNEWTEGGYLEPDTRWGYGYLDATRKVFVEEAAFSFCRQPVNVPELMRTSNRQKVTSVELWEKCRRPEILDFYTQNVFGKRPAEKPLSLDFEEIEPERQVLKGLGTRHKIKATYSGPLGTNNFDFVLYIPNERKSGKCPAFVFIILTEGTYNLDPDNPQWRVEQWPIEEILKRGYATAGFCRQQLSPDMDHGNLLGVFSVYEKMKEYRPRNRWGTISAWAWGASRVMDYLETRNEIDIEKVAVVGHSRCGKTALWAGATDQRFALACSNDSGCSGAKLNHMDLPLSESIAFITSNFPYWFAPNYAMFANREMEMEYDNHMLLALMAPRLVCVGSASLDRWAGQEGEFASCRLASSAWELYGKKGYEGCDEFPKPGETRHDGSIGYHLREGVHHILDWDWKRYLDFAASKGW